MASDAFTYWLDGAPVIVNGLGADFAYWLDGAPVISKSTSLVVTRTLGLLARVSVTSSPTLGIAARVSAVEAQVLGLLAAVQSGGTQLLGLDAAVQGVATQLLGINAQITLDTLRFLGLDAAVQRTTTALLGLIAAVQRTTTQDLGLDARVATTVTQILGLRAVVQAQTPETIGLNARISRPVYQFLGLVARVLAHPNQLLGLNAKVATDVRTKTLGIIGRVSGPSLATLGLNADVRAAMYARLSLAAAVSRSETQLLGVNARASLGPVLNIAARVAASGHGVLGINAQVGAPGLPVVSAGRVPTGRFFPDDDRAYADWGNSPPPDAVVQALLQQEQQLLTIFYENFPNPVAKSDLYWFFDNTYLPINGSELTYDEPVRETVFETVAARSLMVVELEADTPRGTRARKFQITFPLLGIQALRWFQARLRVGQAFMAEFRLMDAEPEFVEIESDPSDSSTYLTWYWGTLPAWKPGSVRVRVNGVEVPDDGSAYRLHPALGAVEFLSVRGADDLVEARFTYRPTVEIVGMEERPKPGHLTTLFELKLTLLEIPDAG